MTRWRFLLALPGRRACLSRHKAASGWAALLLLAGSSVHAQELNLFLGGLRASAESKTTYSWAAEYRTPLAPQWSAGFTWLNEGHLSEHHRDGQAVQLWWHAPASERWRLEAGLGPYYYYDTIRLRDAAAYTNEHGWGVLGSLGVTAFHGKAWTSSLRLNRVQVPGGFNSTGVLLGMGYRFGGGAGDPQSPGMTSQAPAQRDKAEIGVMLGGTILNSFDSERAAAGGISLRWRASPHVGLSLGYIDEGRINGSRRSGFAPQVWLEQDLTPRLSVGAGIGPHVALDKPAGADVSSVSVISSVTMGLRLRQSWIGRLTWNRISTDYNRDSDVVLFGLGRTF